ncbi:hypothetical protein OG689_34655 [Kitasatospora sp. NBC_00240]|uniref:hypothetical protein n=1 Tax=Kitasatospora sp. NBC_00240 TaxID=2903567 RepID=UPI00224D9D03|nr:hypothetical protein [Kitasatospora sp. NBC_00240]MCX5214345.1 hypothetical protein [Kitasatospora sp. NBC_00240]
MGTPVVSGTEGSGAQIGPAQLLAGTEKLRARVRTQLDGSWSALVGFGLLTLAAAPIARHAFNFGASGRSVESYPAFAYAELTGLCVVHGPGDPCRSDEFDGSVLNFAAWGVWFAVLPLAWVACARWYRSRGESRGIVPRLGAWTRITAAATALVLAALFALLWFREQPWEIMLLENRYASPWYLVGVGLVALGLLERSWITVGAGLVHTVLLSTFLGASWGSSWLPWVHPERAGWADGPQLKALLLAAVLLLAGLAQRTVARRRAAGVTGDATAGSSTVAA